MNHVTLAPCEGHYSDSDLCKDGTRRGGDENRYSTTGAVTPFS